ncbi:MAG: nucleoside transporter C-terminal domain-containing protein [Pseudomonadota bacterium]
MSFLYQRVLPVVGYLLILGVFVLLSSDRRRIPWRMVAWGVGLQVGLAALMLLTPAGTTFFIGVNRAVQGLLQYTMAGTEFLLGSGAAGKIHPALHSFLFLVLPTIIFFSSLMAVLYHLGIMQWIVRGLAWGMRKTMRISAAEAMNATANVFVGHTEAPLVVRPYLAGLTPSELMAVMVAGFGTMAGGVIIAYSAMLEGLAPDVAGHLLAASLMNAPAALMAAKIMLPETGVPVTLHGLGESGRGRPSHSEEGFSHGKGGVGERDPNAIGAAARGASEGLKLAANVGAMLLAFIALVALVNGLLSGMLGWVGVERTGPDGRPDALQWALGKLLTPLALLVGTGPEDAPVVARFLGVKMILNEFMAYSDLTEILKGSAAALSERSRVLALYALCGFANLSSIAIQIGGIGALAPARRGGPGPVRNARDDRRLPGVLSFCLHRCDLDLGPKQAKMP